MIEKQRIIDAIRADLDLPEDITDAAIVEICENSSAWAVTGFRLAVNDMKKAVNKAFNCNKYLNG